MGDQESKEELLSVKELADQAGVSTQAVYKQLATKLQTYIVVVGNKKMLRKSALYEVFNVEVCNQNATKLPTELPTNATELTTKIEELKADLARSEEKINSLQGFLDQAEDREKGYRSTIDNLTKLLEQQQQLTAQQQALNLADKQKILELEDKIHEFEAPAVVDQDPKEDPVVESSGIWQKMKSWLGF